MRTASWKGRLSLWASIMNEEYPLSIQQHFWSNVDKGDANDCWPWLGAQRGGGYGRFWYSKQAIYAHRFSYILLKGLIPVELEIDHLCRNRLCVNPDHLEAVTPRINKLRGSGIAAIHARKQCCPKGHTYDVVSADGRRCQRCDKTCQAKRKLKAYP